LISGNRVKEISLIYDLSALFKMDKQKSEITMHLRDAKIKQKKSSEEDKSGKLNIIK